MKFPLNTELNYDFHDANLCDAVTHAEKRQVVLSFDLYPIFYPDKPRLQITLSGLLNFEKVARYFERVRSLSDGDQISAHCYCFQFDSKKSSEDGSVYLFLSLAVPGQIRIHCKELKVEKLQ